MTLFETVCKISDITSVPLMRVRNIATRLRTAGLIRTANDRHNIPEMDPIEVAWLICGVLSSETLEQCAADATKIGHAENINGISFHRYLVKMLESAKLVEADEISEFRWFSISATSEPAVRVDYQGESNVVSSFFGNNEGTPAHPCMLTEMVAAKVMSGNMIAEIGAAA